MANMVEGARLARDWNDLWRAVVLASEGWWRGFVATSNNGAVLFEVGERPGGDAVELQAGRVILKAVLDDPDSMDAESRWLLAREIGVAAERFLRGAADDLPASWTSAMLTALMEQSSERVAFFSKDKRYVRVTAGMSGWHGVVEGDHVGVSLREVLGGIAGSVENVVDEVFSTREAKQNVYYTGALPGRPSRTMVGDYFPVFVDGAVELCGSIVREVRTYSSSRTHAVREAVAAAKRQGADVSGIERAMELAGITSDSCDAHEVALAAAERLHAAGETADVLRWNLFAGDTRIAVNAKLAESVLTEGLLLAGRGRTSLIRTMRRRDHLVFVIEGPVGARMKMHTSEELEQYGGSTQVDGAITIRLPLLAPQQRVADESGTPTV